MINLKQIIAASALLLLLSACSNKSDTGFKVSTVSGATVGLNGTYSTGCVRVWDTISYKYDMKFDGDTVQITTVESDTVPDCSVVSSQGSATSTIIAGTNSAIDGWVDDTGQAASPPTAADGSGPLGETEPFTPLEFTVTATTGSMIYIDVDNGFPIGHKWSLFFVVDDTTAKKVLYFDDDYGDSASLKANISSPYTEQ